MKIKNWKKFQHFKDRRPPWIKLHREILEQRDINTISDRAFRLLVNLWVLASDDKEMVGNLPEISDIAWKLRKSEKEIAELLQDLTPWIDHSGIEVISPCQQPVPPETETEAETEAYKEETEKETKVEVEQPQSGKKPNIPYQRILETMNGHLNTNFKNTQEFKKLVKARYRDGFTEEEFEIVVKKQIEVWNSDDKMRQYLRPTTLFGNKMNNYLGGNSSSHQRPASQREKINQAACDAFINGEVSFSG